MSPAERLEMYRDALDRAEDLYRLADFIDSTARRDRERAELTRRIAALKNKIAHWEQVVNDPTCPICGGDCAGANPPVYNCPLQRHDDLFGPINERNP